MKKVALIGLVLGILGAERVSGETYVSGEVSGNWTTDGSPYIVTADATVTAGSILTIDPGVTVKFAPETSLLVYGTLNAVGTAVGTITFTSSQTTPSAGDWNGIKLSGAGANGSQIKYCLIEYAEQAVYLENVSNVEVSYNTIRENQGDKGADGVMGETGKIGAGIYLFSSTGNTIGTNTICNNTGGQGGNSSGGDGAYNTGGTGGVGAGIYLDQSDNNVISMNVISSSTGGTGGTTGAWCPGGQGGIGAGIYLSSSMDNTISNNTISDSIGGNGGNGGGGDAGGSGGDGGMGIGIYLLSSTGNTLSENALSRNSGGVGGSGWTNGSSGNGFGICINTDSYNNTIDETNTYNGYKIYYFYNMSGINIVEKTIGGSFTTNLGRINLIKCSNFKIENCRISGGRGTNGTTGMKRKKGNPGGIGAGIYIFSSNNGTITGNTIFDNCGGTGGGGGKHAKFYYSHSGGHGGIGAGIYLSSSRAIIIKNNIIRDNCGGVGGVGGGTGERGGEGGIGAGIYLDQSSTENFISGNTFSNNLGGIGGKGGGRGPGGSGGIGAGVYCCSSNNIITENAISDNIGGKGGRGGRVSGGVTDCSGGQGGIGAGIYLLSSTNTVTGNTVSGNAGGEGGTGTGGYSGGNGGLGAGIYLLYSGTTIFYNTIKDSLGGKGGPSESGSSGTDGEGVGIRCKSSNPTVTYNNIYNNETYNLSTDISPDTQIAEYNWWGSDPPDSAKFNGNIDYTPWLTEPYIPPAEMDVIPTSGPVGKEITVEGSEFATQTQIAIHFGITQTITTTTSSDNGTFSVTFFANAQPEATVTITAKDAEGNWATATFILTNKTIYVDDDNTTGPWSGSEQYPYQTIQEGIDAALDGYTVQVEDGTYTGAGNKNLSWSGKHITVKSDNGPENCVIDCENSGRAFNFYNTGQNLSDVISGFTIRNGNVGSSQGGAIFCRTVSPTITNCIFSNNSAKDGGGIYCYNSSPNITNCIFNNNSAYYGGGGICCNYSSPPITNCTFSNNSAGDGGGIYCFSSSPPITNCTFSNNSASEGGGIGCEASSPPITNCTFSNNSANEGGGIYYYDVSSSPITNCTFSNNSAASYGGGIYCRKDCALNITNCIITNNSASSGGGIYARFTYPSIDYSCVWNNSGGDYVGCSPGLNDISKNPQFVDPGNGDYHLKPTSPCIDTGLDSAVPAGITTDLDGNTRTVRTVDMGAYEYQGEPIIESITVTPQSGIIDTVITVEGSGFCAEESVRIDFGTHLTITTVTTNENGTFSAIFTADTQDFGTKIITAEDESENLATAEFVLKPKTKLLFSPESTQAASGTTFNIDVEIKDVENFMGAEIYVGFDPEILQAETATQGGFPDWHTSVINNKYGTVSIACGINLGSPKKTGSGVLSTIRFKAIDIGTANLSFSEQTKIIESSTQTIQFDPGAAKVVVILLHHIYITPGSVTLAVGQSQSFSAQGYDVNGQPLSGVEYSWSIHGNIGTLSTLSGSETILTAATLTASGSLSVACQGVGTYSYVFLVHTEPVSVKIEPSSITITAGDTVDYYSTATDVYGNSWDVTALTQFSASGGGVFTGNSFFGTIAGTYIITGDYSGLSDNATCTINPAEPASLHKVSGDNQVSTATSTLSPMVVRVDDQYGNPVPNVLINFAIDEVPTNAQGQSITPSSSTTDSNGTASTVLTLGDREGIYTVKALAQSIPATVTFRAFASQYYGTVSGRVMVDTGDENGTTGTWIVVELIGKGTVNTTEDGIFIFFDVAPGTYTITADAVGASPVTVTDLYVGTAEEKDVGTLTLISGDATDDGYVGINDFALLYEAFFVYNPEADFNMDGRISSDDFVILYQNFFKGMSRRIMKALTKKEPDASLAISEERIEVREGERFTLSVELSCSVENIGIEGAIEYDPAFFEVVEIRKEKGVYGWSKTESEDGKIRFASGISLGSKLISGSGRIVTVVFLAKKVGRSYIALSDSMLVDSEGAVGLSATGCEVLVKPAVPSTSALFQSFPNPANTGCWIPFQLANSANVSLTIYNILGQKVREIDVGNKPAGFYLTSDSAIYWDTKNEKGELVAAGLYFYKLTAGRFSDVKSMVIRR